MLYLQGQERWRLGHDAKPVQELWRDEAQGRQVGGLRAHDRSSVREQGSQLQPGGS